MYTYSNPRQQVEFECFKHDNGNYYANVKEGCFEYKMLQIFFNKKITHKLLFF